MHTTSAFQLRETALGAAEQQLLCTPNLLCANTFGLSDNGFLESSLRDHATLVKCQHNSSCVAIDRGPYVCLDQTVPQLAASAQQID
jgi:hypothetical protein